MSFLNKVLGRRNVALAGGFAGVVGLACVLNGKPEEGNYGSRWHKLEHKVMDTLSPDREEGQLSSALLGYGSNWHLQHSRRVIGHVCNRCGHIKIKEVLPAEIINHWTLKPGEAPIQLRAYAQNNWDKDVVWATVSEMREWPELRKENMEKLAKTRFRETRSEDVPIESCDHEMTLQDV